MKISELLEISQDNEREHFDALEKTGFYGKQGSGSIFLAKNTGKIGIAHRSYAVEQPGTWGTVGGAIDENDDPKSSAIREAEEELGYRIQSGDSLIPIDTFQKSTFKYTTFLYIVQREFKPILNWESQDFIWTDLQHLPDPLHFGLAATLSKPAVVNIIEKEISKYADKRNFRG